MTNIRKKKKQWGQNTYRTRRERCGEGEGQREIEMGKKRQRGREMEKGDLPCRHSSEGGGASSEMEDEDRKAVPSSEIEEDRV